MKINILANTVLHQRFIHICQRISVLVTPPVSPLLQSNHTLCARSR